MTKKRKKRSNKFLFKCIFPYDGNCSVYGIIGNPLIHTASPSMHNSLFRKYGMHSIYIPFEIKKNSLRSFIKVSKDFLRAYNVTVPYKRDIIDYLDEIDKNALEIGAVNTVLNKDGKLIGYNTDYVGLKMGIKKDLGITLKNKNVIILGAGGAATSAVYLSVLEKSKKVFVINRTYKKAVLLKKKFGKDVPIIPIHLDKENEVRMAFENSNVLIQTTSIGLKKTDPLIINEKFLSGIKYVYDMIYNPFPTKLLNVSKKYGAKVAGGLSMLVFQGAKSFEIWTGKKPNTKLMEKSAKKVVYYNK